MARRAVAAHCEPTLTLTLALAPRYSSIRRLVSKAMADFHLQPIDPDDGAAMMMGDRL